MNTSSMILAAISFAQAQEVPPLPPLRGDAANLKDTMKFIEDKLPSEVNYMVYTHNNIAGTDGSLKRSFEVSAVTADASSCSIEYHVWYDSGKNNLTEQNPKLHLKQVRDVVLTQMDVEIQQANARAGRPELSVKVEPPIYLVQVKVELTNGKTGSVLLNFYDQTLSERVSKALQHAVELCGGGKTETF